MLSGPEMEGTTYRIAGNFGEVFNVVNWRFCGKSPKLNPPILFHILLLYVEALMITKLKIRQCILMTDSMLAKVSCYTVFEKYYC